MAKRISRRRFLKYAGATSAGAVLALAGCAPPAAPPPAAAPTSAPAAAAATAVPAATAAPAPTAAPVAAAEPKIVRIRLYGDMQSIDPAFRISNNDETIIDAVFSKLVGYGPGSYELKNDLAEKIEQSEDGKTITFKLREGVMWPKGYGELTAEDVKYSYERIADPALKAAYADDWAALDHVEVIDKYNGKIILKEPFAALWKTTLPIGSGAIVSKKWVEEVGVEKFQTDVIGTGPYYIADWQQKQQITLKRNPDYYGEPPAFDEIHFFPMEDDKTAEIALEAGEIDFGRISTASIQRYESGGDVKLIRKPSLRFRWIGMDVENPKLQDINVRQAIRYALDVPGIVKATYMGQADVEYALIPPGLVGYWKDAPHYERDVAKAKEFMQKAGVDTLDLQIDIQDTTEYRSWAEIAQQNLKEIGINLTINPLDSSAYWSLGEKGKEVELFAGNYSMQPDPSWATMWFTCAQVGIWNWERWCNEEYDALHAKALVTMDDKEREALYIKMQQVWDADAKAIFITHGEMDYGYLPTIQPVTTPHGIMQPVYFKPA
jgi:peptide/nickel transport system substrate-binding protein